VIVEPTTASEMSAGIAFVRYGAKGGKPVIALHGSPGCHLTFRNLDLAAKSASVDLIALDRFGYGDTVVPPTRDLHVWSTKLRTFVDEMKLDRLSIVGTSGGTPYALALAAELGERVHSVGIVAGVGEFRRSDLNKGMLGLNKMMSRAAAINSSCANLVGSVVMALSKLAPELFLKAGMGLLPSADQTEMKRPDVHNTYVEISNTLGFHRGVAFGSDFSVFNTDWVQSVRDLSAPVRWWHGLQDKNVPIVHAENVIEGLKNGELIVVKEGGHLLLWLVGKDVLHFVSAQL